MNELIKGFQNLDKTIVKHSKKCLKFTFSFCIIATLFLVTYKFYSSPVLFFIGASLLKYGLVYCICIIVFAIAFSKIKAELDL